MFIFPLYYPCVSWYIPCLFFQFFLSSIFNSCTAYFLLTFLVYFMSIFLFMCCLFLVYFLVNFHSISILLFLLILSCLLFSFLVFSYLFIFFLFLFIFLSILFLISYFTMIMSVNRIKRCHPCPPHSFPVCVYSKIFIRTICDHTCTNIFSLSCWITI